MGKQLVGKVCFFHLGEATAIPSMMVESLRLAYSDSPCRLEVIQVSSASPPRVAGADHFLEVPEVSGCDVMTARIKASLQASDCFASDVAYVDTDMLFVRPIEVPSFDAQSAVLCRRSWTKRLNARVSTPWGDVDFPEYEGKAIESVMPYLASFVVASGSSFWRQCWSLSQVLDERHKRWYGDQVVLREVSKLIQPVFVEEWTHACLPEYTGQVDRSRLVAMHYKGRRKIKMAKHLEIL